jgi:mono/diheme cytochrome c family protein
MAPYYPPRLTVVRAAAAIAVVLAVAGCGGGGRPADAARQLFVSAGCGDCHTLADARTRGTSGPTFDTRERLDRPQLLQAMVEGANGMPSYADRLTAQQRARLADYLLRVAWGRGS